MNRDVTTLSALHIAVLIVVISSSVLGADAPRHCPYKIGSEDVISVTVARHAQFSGDFYIPTDGVVDLPGVGRVTATGKTLGELSDYVTTRLSKRLRDPEVTVTLKSPRMQRVYVLGSVERPGALRYEARLAHHRGDGGRGRACNRDG